MTPAGCRARAAVLRTGAQAAPVAAAHEALLAAADEYEKLAREIEKAGSTAS